MAILGGIVVLILIAMVFLMTFMSYPTAVMLAALWLYRHAREIAEMQRKQTARVNEEWMRELERSE